MTNRQCIQKKRSKTLLTSYIKMNSNLINFWQSDTQNNAYTITQIQNSAHCTWCCV